MSDKDNDKDDSTDENESESESEESESKDTRDEAQKWGDDAMDIITGNK